MPQWTVEQVLALAPDASSASAGKDLSNPVKWASSGCDSRAAWGEAKGSGAKPYQTSIDLAEPAFKCTCPSRKFPCKHSLGLFIQFAKGELSNGDAPPWVTEWLDKRAGKAEAAQVKKTEAAPDPEAKAKRSAKRSENVLQGFEECESFLMDSVRQGLLANTSDRAWKQMAARMVDAQAPGVARRLLDIADLIGVGPTWVETVSARVGRLYLLIEAFRRIDTLDADLQAEVRTQIGFNLKQEDQLGAEYFPDLWQVVAVANEVDDKLKIRRSWLYGEGCGKWAMHLDFSVGNQSFSYLLSPGTAMYSAARFFQSPTPLRVALEEQVGAPFSFKKAQTISQSISSYATTLAKNPWLAVYPMLISPARLSRIDSSWFITDEEGLSVPIWPGFKLELELLAVSGAEPCCIFGEWDGHALRPRSAWGSWGFMGL